jgi:hypothetical protein
MTTRNTITLAARCFAGAALAALLSAAALADEPKATPGWGPQTGCIGETDVFTNDKGPHFSMTLTNKCEAKLACKVWAYVITARGPTQGATVMHLGPKSSGAAASKTYVFRVRVAGGSAEAAHRCRPE